MQTSKVFCKLYSIFTDGSGSEIQVYYVLKSPENIKKLESLQKMLNTLNIPRDDTQYEIELDVELDENAVDILVKYGRFSDHDVLLSNHKLDREINDVVLPDIDEMENGVDDLFQDL